jgi:hypothetical protein
MTSTTMTRVSNIKGPPDLIPQLMVVELGEGRFRVDRYIATKEKGYWLLMREDVPMDLSPLLTGKGESDD